MHCTSTAIIEAKCAMCAFSKDRISFGKILQGTPAHLNERSSAWPDPKYTSSFEFCENDAKAVA
jgi:hypothetical protein